MCGLVNVCPPDMERDNYIHIDTWRAEIDPNFTRENLPQRPALFCELLRHSRKKKMARLEVLMWLKVAIISGFVNKYWILDDTLTVAPIVSLIFVESESISIFIS